MPRTGNTKKSAHAPLEPEDGWDQLAIDRPDDDRAVYRLSQLGGDVAQLVGHALKIPHAEMPDSLRPYLDEGKAAEDNILAMLRVETGYRRATYGELAYLIETGVIAGYNAAEEQMQVALDVGSSARLQGHADGIEAIGKGEARSFVIVEAKAFGPSNWEKWTKQHDIIRDFPRYAWQVSGLIACTGLPVCFVVGEKDRATIDGDESGASAGAIRHIDYKLYSPEKIPFGVAQVKARVLKAQALVKKGEPVDCEQGHWPCPFYREDWCLGKPAADVEDVDDEELGQLLALDYAYTQDMANTDEQKQAEKDRKDVRAKIRELVEVKSYASGKKMRVWSPVGEEFEFEWVRRVTKPSDGYTSYYPSVKLVSGE